MFTITAQRRPYALAIAAVFVTVALRFLLDPLMGEHLPFYLFYFAVFACAMLAGPGPGSLALLASTVATAYFFLHPRYALTPLQGESLLQVLRFLSIGGLLVATGAFVRALRLRLDHETRERLQAQEMSRRAVDNALRVLASVGDGLMTADEQGRITFMNAMAEELTGWSSNAAIGRPAADVFKIIAAGTDQIVADPVQRSLREARVVSIPPGTVLIRRDGTQHLIDDSAAPIRDETGRIVGSVLLFRSAGGTVGEAQARFEILDLDLMPLHSIQIPLSPERLARLEQKCRLWLLREWVPGENTVRIVAFDDVQVLIHQDSAVTMLSGAMGIRFQVSYELWKPSAAH